MLFSKAVLLFSVFATANSVMAQLSTVPPNIAASVAKPMMMIAASRDHTLFGPVYSDFEDVDDDGIIDFTFKPTFSYYGYFDSSKCYEYSTSNARFQPAAAATVVGGRFTCSSTANHWSGNFLNWATMTRLDTMRKMLYGGKRSTDSATRTVLERANLSQDAHSFAKYYKETDIRDYTPYTVAYLSNGGTYEGLTICNRSDANNSGGNPVIRVARGNYELWATTAQLVCRWSGEGGPSFSAALAATYIDPTLGGATIAHRTAAPNETNDGAVYNSIGPQLTVRVEVCNSSLIGNERCQLYGTVNKPIGLLQEFGSSLGGSLPKAEFGVITGSYESNIEGGALRKNMDSFDSEINSTNGRFCHISGGCSTTVSGGIAAFDNIVLYGAGDYNGNNGLNFALADEMVNGLFPAWGNPIGEMILQAYRYYGGFSVTRAPSWAGLTTGIDNALGIPTASATDPLISSTSRTADFGKPICRPMSVLAISSSSISHDRNYAGFNDLPNRAGRDAASYTNLLGTMEGINGTSRAVGSITGGWGTDCSAKSITNLSDVTGVCPDLPGGQGSYLLAGTAFYANTSKITNAYTLPKDAPSTSLTVQTYAAALRGGAGRIEVKIPGTSRFFYITPESSWNNRDYAGGSLTGGPSSASRVDRYPNRPTKTTGTLMPGGMLVFKAISSSATHGAFVVTWNDTQAGNDYDMDIVGFLRYDLSGSGAAAKVKVTSHILDQEAGALGSHGFSIIGTTEDGKFITHGINNFQDEGVCLNVGCQLSGAVPYTKTFSLTGVSPAASLEDPLWYAAKYGSFETKNFTTTTSVLTTATWDSKRTDARPCGGTTGLSCSDGIPDGYFLARRPELLEKQLREQLENIVASSNAAPAVSSSQLIAGSFKYVAKFDPTLKRGSIEAYRLNAQGDFDTAKSWDAGEILKQLPMASRQIITNANGTGIPFTWATLPAAYKTALKGTTSTSLDNRAQAVVEYMRGDTSNEAPNGERLQARSVSNILGTIVNSTPWIQVPPSAAYFDAYFPSTGVQSYRSFANANATRKKILWSGANDGMLHGFDAETAAPVLSYVPRLLVPDLFNLVADSGTIRPGVDGSPFTGDVLVSAPPGQTSTWATYLFGSLGRGGKGVFALDVTDVNALNESNASSIFKWQFSSANDSDVGNMIGDYSRSTFSNQATPIVRLNNGQFAVAMPNGAESTNGRSVIFLLPVNGPPTGTTTWTLNTNYYKLTTNGTDTLNGMMGLNWVDLDNNGTVDLIYGTDLKGNVWKFDLTSSNPALWGSAVLNTVTSATTPPVPFYRAVSPSNQALPITTSPVFGFPSEGGIVVVFGTGKALISTDFPKENVTQRIFGIYDRTSLAGTSTVTVSIPTGTTTLIARTTTVSVTDTVRLSSSPVIDYKNKNGWYFDFPRTSEMMLSSPQSIAGQIAFTTVRKLVTTTEACFETPPSSIYFMNPVSGTASDPSGIVAVPTLDQKLQVVIDSTPRSQGGSGGCTGVSCVNRPKSEQVCKVNTLGTRLIGQNEDGTFCLPTTLSRIQWREIPGLITR